MERLTVYVDGSYNKDTKVYGYGMVIITDTDILHRNGCGVDTEGVWNIAGEVTGAVKAIEYALENGYDELTICHDYEGIQKWADGEWKAKKMISKDYVDVVRNARNSGLEISFRKIKAHSGDTYNEKADRLAKQAIIITDRKEVTGSGLVLGKSGEEHKITVNLKVRESKEELENKYGKIYHAYAEDILNQIMEYAKSTHKASPHNFTMQVLVEALYQMID